ncbi:hypothetical protein [Desulfosporosinus sp. FKB]|uniref:hypothetical protein n=1 Tax=Desulfosporosinus sp. FKB TaxID=1969835 RepID=UPI000B4A467A|nr:hypothetical protein [Desulfosporosinus sp. FKB]
MVNKLLSIILGAVLWGLGTYLNIVVAIGKYGLPAFLAGVLLALGFLVTKALSEEKTSIDLWIIILRGLAVESLLFPLANLAMVYLLAKGFPLEETRAVLIESGLIAVILAGVFFFNAHLLNTKIRRWRMGIKK